VVMPFPSPLMTPPVTTIYFKLSLLPRSFPDLLS